MLYVLGLVAAFASFWFVVAALQTFEPAGPARPLNILGAILAALLAAAFFWAGRRFKALLIVLLLLAGLAGIAGGQPAATAIAAGEQIVISTDPPLSQIHPHGGPSAGIGPDKLIVEVKDGAGRNVPNVKLDVQVETPATNWFISTDVPRIEGRPVINWSGVSADGRQVFEYIFPVRGAYHVTVKASPAPGAAASFSPITRDASLSISEKPTSYLYLGLFLAALFLFGAVSGIVLGKANLAGRPG